MPSRNHKKKSNKGLQKGGLQKGGDCGCDKQRFFTGGLALGPVSSINVGTQSTIPLNNYQNDLIAPAAQDASRMDPNPNVPFNPFWSGGQRTGGQRVGGQKRTNKKGYKKSTRKRNNKKSKITRKRKVRGGGDPASDAILNGSTLTAGTVLGAPIGANILMGNTIPILNPDQLNSSQPLI